MRASPRVRFDYTAEGWQAMRVHGRLAVGPVHGHGELGRLRSAAEGAGAEDGDGELVGDKLRLRPARERLPACPERGGGSRRCLRGGGPDPDLGHDAEDQPTQQVDDFGTTGSTADDEQLSWEYSPTGLETKRTLAKNAGTPTTWTNEQVSTRTYFANGLLKTLTTTDGAATPVTVQDHSLSYEAGGVYVNGNRARDVFTLLGPDAAAPCRASTCTASWGYDARERVLQEVNGTGGVTDFTLDVVGNVSQEKQNGAVARTASCSAQQLASETVSGTTKRYLYDPSGHVDCVTANGWASAACPGAGDGNLLVDYGYDYKNRLAA